MKICSCHQSGNWVYRSHASPRQCFLFELPPGKAKEEPNSTTQFLWGTSTATYEYTLMCVTISLLLQHECEIPRPICKTTCQTWNTSSFWFCNFLSHRLRPNSHWSVVSAEILYSFSSRPTKQTPMCTGPQKVPFFLSPCRRRRVAIS